MYYMFAMFIHLYVLNLSLYEYFFKANKDCYYYLLFCEEPKLKNSMNSAHDLNLKIVTSVRLGKANSAPIHEFTFKCASCKQPLAILLLE